jgi:tRNA (guanine-N7-)-methyltransferase
MSRSLKYDFAGPDFRVAAEDLAGPGLAKAFEPDLEPPLRLTVDLGFGRGELLLDLASAEPQAAFLGVEYSYKRVLKLARRLARTPLRNLRLVCATAEAIVEDRLPEGFVHAFWINFPDPWPKKRHHRRRLIHPAFVQRLARRLEPGGRLHVATDHGYAEAIAEVLGRAAAGTARAGCLGASSLPPALRRRTSQNGRRRAATESLLPSPRAGPAGA